MAPGMNQAQRDGSIAEKSQAAAQKRLEAVGVELRSEIELGCILR
jgi:hypothetical protein